MSHSKFVACSRSLPSGHRWPSTFKLGGRARAIDLSPRGRPREQKVTKRLHGPSKYESSQAATSPLPIITGAAVTAGLSSRRCAPVLQKSLDLLQNLSWPNLTDELNDGKAGTVVKTVSV